MHCDSRCWLYEGTRRLKVFVWIEVYLPNKSIRLRQPGGPTPRTPETIMSTEPLRLPNGETYREKALRKFKQQPLVPLGSSNPSWGGIHMTDSRGRGPSHHVHASDGCKQTEEASVQGHELLVARSRDCAGVHHCCGCGWRLDDGPDETPDWQIGA